MKLRRIATIAIIAATAILLTGCQDELKQQLTDCQDSNAELKTQLESQQQALIKKEGAVENSVNLITQTLIENQKLRNEIKALKKAHQSQPKPIPQTQTPKPSHTPEEKARIKREGLQKLFEMQRKSAEKMRLERLKKEGKK